MKKIFRKNKKANLLKHSYQPLNTTQYWSDSEHTQSSQDRNDGCFRMTLLRGVQTAILPLALTLCISSPAIAQAPIPTLDSTKEQNTAFINSQHSTYPLTQLGADEQVPEGAVSLNIGDKTYYYTPDENNKNVLQSLASTGSSALIETSSDKALYSVDGKYYTYDTNKLKDSAYNLKEAASADEPNTITLYDKTEIIKYYDPQSGQEVAAGDRQEGVQYKEITTIQTTPKYYTVELKQPQYGSTSGTESITYGWEKTTEGTLEFKENPTNPQGQTITYKYSPSDFSNTVSTPPKENAIRNPSGTSSDNPYQFEGGVALNNPAGSSVAVNNVLYKDNVVTSTLTSTASSYSGRDYAATQGGAINNAGEISSLTGAFVNNGINAVSVGNYASNYAYGGAIYNSGTIGDIAADFIGNYVSSDSDDAHGGAIYNSGSNAKIGNIAGNFIGNYASGGSSKGGAIYNDYGTIGDITGDFIGNYADDGGAIYNYNGATIGDITGDFIGNSAGSSGGAIYNDEGTIGDITGDFIGNYASSTGSYAQGGAIYNRYGTIGNITGDFIGNYASGYSGLGGAIYNYNGTIGNITGDFIGNSGGAIYNTGEIGDITGDFIGNSGGAIYNTGEIGNITGDFIDNKGGVALQNTGTIKHQTGNFIANENGAIHNAGTITNITGDFIGNNAVYPDMADYYHIPGAAFLNGGSITNITGNFIGNTNGAIYNSNFNNSGHQNKAIIENITGLFIKNSGHDGSAIYNNATITNINGDFIQNENAIYNGGHSPYGSRQQVPHIEKIKGNFIENTNSAIKNDIVSYDDSCGGISGYGSSIINTIESSDFIGNAGTNGGAIYNLGKINEIKDTDFIGNSATSKGGAIYTTTNLNIIAKDNGQSVFSGNYTESAGVKDQNAIYVETINDSYTNTDRNIISIENNKVTLEEITEAQAPSSTPTMTLNASTNGVIVFDDTIDGNIVVAGTNTVTKTGDLVLTDYAKEDLGFETVEEYIAYVKADGWYDEGTTDEEIIAKGLNIGDVEITNEQTVSTESKGDKYSYILALDGDETGAIYLNNKIINANITLDNTNVFVSEGSNLASSKTLAVNSGVLNINHLADQTINFEKFSNSGNINLDNVDVNLQNKTMGRITADTYGDMSGSINVKNLTLLNDAAQNVTHVLFADPEYTNSVIYTGAPQVAYSPIWKYDVSYGTPIDNDPQGYFTFVRGDSGDSGSYNPSVLSTPVMQQAGAYVNQMQAFNYVFEHSTVFMNLPYTERLSIKERNKIALSPTGDATDIGVYSPLMLKQDLHGFWFKPYASFENIPLKNGPKVSNINYGTLIGYDSEMRTTQYGWDRVYTGYIGYNGASQRYAGVNAYQNGGILGGTVTFYKNNFFNATTVSVGATAGDATNMYGSENYTMLIAGIANKAGYNLEFWDGRMILQPSMMISYTFANTFDYNNAAGVRIESDPLNAIQLAPGIKLIGNTKNGWQPYLAVNMVWNLLDSAKVTANDVRLPEMSIRPYVQYGIGVQKNFKEDRITGYGQAMIHNGGRNGVSLTAGIRWNVGRE